MASRAPLSAFIIQVAFEAREDGGLRATCEKVPNFFLSHSDPELVRADVVPALSVILSDMFGVPMQVEPLRDLEDARGDDVEHMMPAHLCNRQNYVGISQRN